MQARLLISALTLAATAAATGLALAATPASEAPAASAPAAAAAAKAPATTTATTPAAHPKKAAAHKRARRHRATSHTAMDRMHQHVVTARSADEGRWVAVELHDGHLSPAQAASLRAWVARVSRDQQALTRRGHETYGEAVAISHEQDQIDWSIHTGQAMPTSVSQTTVS